ncbi:hypothetical protein G9A89_008677 [Geosiphon pyriformis]|nr:hypothetical protein G9A89_008677 [Geosiphon pyriformis]
MTEFQPLTTLLKRLEAATSRLEDLATSGVSAVGVNTNLARNSLSNQPVATSLVSPPSYDIVDEAVLPPALAAYDELIEIPLKHFVELSKRIGGLSHAVEDIFLAQRDFIFIASQSIKPTTPSETFVELIKPTQQALEKVCEYRENNRPSPFFNHLSTVSEGIGALGWVSVDPKPAPFVGDLKDSSQFYAHRVIKEFKDKDRTHVEWANSFVALLTELQNYVKKYHITGLVWNSQGVEAKTFVGRKLAHNSGTNSAGTALLSVGGPPAPPPPPSLTDSGIIDFVSAKGQADMSSVFAELNRGESIVDSLKKVDKSQMTHKNPSLRTSGIVKGQKKGPTAPPKPVSLSLKKPPKTQLDGTKWTIENYENNSNLLIEETAINHTVYIYGCKNSTIQIKGKVNAITLDSCQKTGLLVDSAVATVDIVNSRSFQLQILGRTPTIVIDKSDSGQIFLSPECMDIEILTAKSSSINVNIPGAGQDGDFAERPVPEQVKSTIFNGKLVSTTVEHTG